MATKPNDDSSLSHIRWNCKCHIVFIPKYRWKGFIESFGQWLRHKVRVIIIKQWKNEYGSYMYEEDKYNSLRQAACYYYLTKFIPDLESNYLASNGFRFDLYSKNLNLLIEIDSKEFHEYTESKDRENDEFAKESGITIARLNPQYKGDFDNINAYARSLNEEYFSYLDDRSCDVNDGVLMCLLYVRAKFNVDVSGLDIDCRRDLVKINENRNIFNNYNELGDDYINEGKYTSLFNAETVNGWGPSIVEALFRKYGYVQKKCLLNVWWSIWRYMKNKLKYWWSN